LNLIEIKSNRINIAFLNKIMIERLMCVSVILRGLVPLHNACSYGHYEVAELLVRHGASVNVADLWKFTPLHEAAAKGKYEICKLLLKYNTCVNATDKWAFTPLHEAAQKGRTQLCALLLAHGADPTMKNQEGQTPLDLATGILYCTLGMGNMVPNIISRYF
uniref:Uncharacterized protein n=1 Tax=Astyanax mexicanus TaxID=7994 RepID=A0A3B1K5L9_ASTMX